MPGINQLPAGAEGAAALSFTYSGISLICSCILCWLTVVHREGWSYVFLLCISTGVSTVMSLAQQTHDIFYYEDIIREQFLRKAHFTESPELAIANGSFGVDLVLYYFQYWSYNVQALLVMFWASELAQSVYGLSNRPRTRQVFKRINIAGKAISFIFPAITILTLRAPSLHSNFVAFILLADLPLMISLACGSLLMILILVRYIKTKKGFTHWAPASYQNSSNGGGTASSVAGQTEFSSTQYSSSVGARKPKSARKQSFHDRWLMVRFTVSFLILAVFEVTNILFQLQSIRNLENDSKLTEPDLSVARASTTFFLFLPGTTAGIFLFIVFGTTAGCRAKMRETFTPKWWRMRQEQKRAERDGGGDLEYNHQGVMDTYEGPVGGGGGGNNGKGRIVRSSSVTVTYHNKANGDSVPLESLPPHHHHRSQQGRKMSFKSADDLLLESDGDTNGDSDKDSTSEIMIGAAAPATSSATTTNNHNNTTKAAGRSRSSSSTGGTSENSKAAAAAFAALNKPLPIPQDTPMARIAHFQSITRPQTTHSRTRTTTSIPEHEGESDESKAAAMMSRQFAEHQRRQVPSSLSSSASVAAQSHQQQQQQQAPMQKVQTLSRQWTHGNSSRSAGVGAAGSAAVNQQQQQQPQQQQRGAVLGEEYYGSSPEHSDDSGPVLPIMAAKRS
ncbi:uncharacterized protein B0I36DRAFT_334366 [Microdochium trichocladiopsis]|uniref:Glycoside hydrolase n=1 Tax=Microdochium trichocladiopsis TaxID=1682393 RepID=A0A9P9BKN3_9PEZI|nr:uncharacterized protein B0I36DRAFT_334366 [Microdochium trichocladiopsis]KAH7021386.1 hypothetical protein B0I36DRAFT_334366 [Microdochium trichocladiopsis]